jgi:hypothetical protein
MGFKTVNTFDFKTGERSSYEVEVPDPSIEQLRANASMSRAKFLQACIAVGVIEPSVAEEAASGVWPSAFDGFLLRLKPLG